MKSMKPSLNVRERGPNESVQCWRLGAGMENSSSVELGNTYCPYLDVTFNDHYSQILDDQFSNNDIEISY